MVKVKNPISSRAKKNKEYVKYAEEISWVTTLKDVYRRYSVSSDQFFYIRHSSFLCCFRREQGAEKIAELIPSALLTRQIRDKNIQHSSVVVNETD